MKIICAGYWKTGTKSLAEALRILGYKVYDFDDQCLDLGEFFDKFYDGTVTDEEIYSTLKDVDVLIDGPVIAFWEEIHKVFPEAKIILTSREENSWYKSYRGMHNAFSWKLMLRMYLSMFVPNGFAFGRRLATLGRFCNGIEGLMSFQFSDNPRLYKLKFRKHNSYVLHRAPKDKLLIHESKDGWSPLCEFLGRDVPNQPFPERNKAGSVPVEESQNPHLRKLINQTKILLYVVIAIFSILLCWVISSVL